MITGSCHCGTITFEISEKPAFMVACNCSICRRLATLWVHAPPAKITLNAPKNATNTYVWGDKSLVIHTCKTCGCTTHWASLEGTRFAVNCRLSDPADIKNIRTRHFDGADSWEFLD
ncbi:MAG: hypothetical protein V3V13_05200 [Paracoccaceae bacterium]